MNIVLVNIYKSSHEQFSFVKFILFNLIFLKKNLNELNIILLNFSFFPFLIKKFINFNKGNSKFLVLKDALFLKQIGTSIILLIKNLIKDVFLK